MKKRNTLVLLAACLFVIIGCSNPFVNDENDSSKKDSTTNDQVQNKGELFPLGAVDDDPELIKKMGVFEITTTRKSLPSSVDIMNNMPGAGYQRWGSCVGWAVGYALKTYQEGQEENWNINTTDHQFSPYWIWCQLNGGQNKGIAVSSALNLVKENGCDTFNNFNPSQYNIRPDSASMNRARWYRGLEWGYLSNSLSTLKIFLSEGKPVVFRVDVYPDFDAIGPSNLIYDDNSGSRRGGHALCLVGYDDSKGAFKFINSWGSTWGDGTGCGWISYDFVTNSSRVGFQAYYLTDGINGPSSPYGPYGPYGSKNLNTGTHLSANSFEILDF